MRLALSIVCVWPVIVAPLLATEPQLLKTLTGDGSKVLCVAFSPSYATEGRDCPSNKDLRSFFGESFHYIGMNSSILRSRRGRVIPRRWSNTF